MAYAHAVVGKHRDGPLRRSTQVVSLFAQMLAPPYLAKVHTHKGGKSACVRRGQEAIPLPGASVRRGKQELVPHVVHQGCPPFSSAPKQG